MINLTKEILEILQGYEPVKNVNEFGFYWEHEDVKQSSEKIASLVKQSISKAVKAELESLLKNGHGGGNWRRLIITKVEQLEIK